MYKNIYFEHFVMHKLLTRRQISKTQFVTHSRKLSGFIKSDRGESLPQVKFNNT